MISYGATSFQSACTLVKAFFFFMVRLSTQERIGVGTYYQENLMKCWEGVNILFSDIPYLGAAIPLVASCYRAIFKQVSKVIQHCTSCTLLRSVIGLENLRHPLNQSEAKLKPTMGWSPTFSALQAVCLFDFEF